MELVVFTGIQAAGKSTFFRERFFDTHVRINLPAWQRRGLGIVWETYEKAGHNPKTGEATATMRRRLKTILELPIKDEYAAFVGELVDRGDSAGH